MEFELKTLGPSEKSKATGKNDTYIDPDKIKKYIDNLSATDLQKITELCDARKCDIKRAELEALIIPALKNRYGNNSQLVTLSNGFKITKYVKNRGQNYCNYFEVEFCNVSENCDKNGCLHLSLKGVNDDIDHKLTHITYCLYDNKQYKNYTHFGWYQKNYFNFDQRCLDKIMDEYLLDRDNLINKRKGFLGLYTVTENKLDYYIQNIIEAITDYK